VKHILFRIQYIAQLFKAPVFEIGHAIADTGRWTVEKSKAVVQKAKDVSPVTIIRKDELDAERHFEATWQDTQGGTD